MLGVPLNNKDIFEFKNIYQILFSKYTSSNLLYQSLLYFVKHLLLSRIEYTCQTFFIKCSYHIYFINISLSDLLFQINSIKSTLSKIPCQIYFNRSTYKSIFKIYFFNSTLLDLPFKSTLSNLYILHTFKSTLSKLLYLIYFSNLLPHFYVIKSTWVKAWLLMLQ